MTDLRQLVSVLGELEEGPGQHGGGRLVPGQQERLELVTQLHPGGLIPRLPPLLHQGLPK